MKNFKNLKKSAQRQEQLKKPRNSKKLVSKPIYWPLIL